MSCQEKKERFLEQYKRCLNSYGLNSDVKELERLYHDFMNNMCGNYQTNQALINEIENLNHITIPAQKTGRKEQAINQIMEEVKYRIEKTLPEDFEKNSEEQV